MTNEEALKRIKQGEPFAEIYDEEWEQSMQIAISVLEKQIPKKPNRTGRPYRCPTCGSSEALVGKHLPNYCKYCGQRFDWGCDDD